jgi:hypothetical protein
MSAPVTRGELRAELAQLETRFDEKLELWGGALLARMDQRFEVVDQRFAALEQRFEQRFERMAAWMTASMAASEQRLMAEMARHATAGQEYLSTQIAVVDQKYAGLPARVDRLETKVFKPRASRSRR